jgi:hypothetical protein
MEQIRCAFCLRELDDPRERWKDKYGLFFCSEFCAESDPQRLLIRPDQRDATASKAPIQKSAASTKVR